MLLSNPINALENTSAIENEVVFGPTGIDIQQSFLSVQILKKKTLQSSGSSKFFSSA